LLRITDRTLFPVGEVMRTAGLQGSASVTAALPITLRGKLGFGGNPRAVDAVARITSGMTEYLVQETAETVRNAIITAVNEGVPPAKTARDLIGLMDKRTGKRTGGIMVLDDQRAGQAQRVRAMLGDKDEIRKYFIKDKVTGKMKPRYKTTDRRFDKRVRDAINEGRALSNSDIDQIANRHMSRLLKDRATQIAHDNTLTALRAGQHAGFEELVETGAVDDDQMERTWLSTGDSITRPDHQAMNGTKVYGMNTPYTFPDMSQALYPGDTSLGAPIDQTTYCRCIEVVRIIPKKNHDRAEI